MKRAAPWGVRLDRATHVALERLHVGGCRGTLGIDDCYDGLCGAAQGKRCIAVSGREAHGGRGMAWRRPQHPQPGRGRRTEFEGAIGVGLGCADFAAIREWRTPIAFGIDFEHADLGTCEGIAREVGDPAAKEPWQAR